MEKDWVQSWLSLTSCMTLGKFLNFCEPQFPYFQKGDNTSALLADVVRGE